MLIFQGALVSARGAEVIQIGKIKLSQAKSALMAAASFIKTEDDVFIVPDYKDGNLKLYDINGNLIKIWGTKGPGPLEFLSPVSCDYKKPLIAIFDLANQRIFIYRRVGRTEFERLSEFVCLLDKPNIKLLEDQVLIPGFIAVSATKQYGLYMRNLKTGHIQYILPEEIKYGFTSFSQFDSQRLNTVPVGTAGYCDTYGNFIYYVWEGNLRIIKINKLTNKYEFFGETPNNYVKPRVTKELQEGFRILSREVIEAEFSKMSFITGIFADKDFVGVIYKKYDAKKSLWEMSLQLYTPEGKLFSETVLANAVTYINFRANNSFYDRDKRILYYLSIVYDENTSLDKYEIIMYKINL